jgi:HAD superfamily hydrolase (TIGR01484 family)
MGTDGYRAALIDLDGTLARASLEIAPRVAEAVARLAEHVAVAIVSSRDHVVVRRTARSLGLAGLQVSEGGARIFDPVTGDTSWVRWLEPDDARGILTFLEQHDLPFTAVDRDGSPNAHGVSEIKEWRVTRITAISLTEPQAREIAADFGVLEDVHTSIIVRIDNGDWMVDFTHATATKATAVGRYAAIKGMAPSQLIAAGDSYNDLPLLEACGLRIAMGNAAPELKAIADYVAPTVDEDGLAVAIDEFLLPLLERHPGTTD